MVAGLQDIGFHGPSVNSDRSLATTHSGCTPSPAHWDGETHEEGGQAAGEKLFAKCREGETGARGGVAGD